MTTQTGVGIVVAVVAFVVAGGLRVIPMARRAWRQRNLSPLARMTERQIRNMEPPPPSVLAFVVVVVMAAALGALAAFAWDHFR